MEVSSHLLQILVVTLVLALCTNAQQLYTPDTYTNLLEASDYQPIMFRQERDPMKNPLPHVPGRRLAWNMLIRPGMAGGFKKRVSEREINSLLKNTWLG